MSCQKRGLPALARKLADVDEQVQGLWGRLGAAAVEGSWRELDGRDWRTLGLRGSDEWGRLGLTATAAGARAHEQQEDVAAAVAAASSASPAASGTDGAVLLPLAAAGGDDDGATAASAVHSEAAAAAAAEGAPSPRSPTTPGGRRSVVDIWPGSGSEPPASKPSPFSAQDGQALLEAAKRRWRADADTERRSAVAAAQASGEAAAEALRAELAEAGTEVAAARAEAVRRAFPSMMRLHLG
eukprot:COSAG01_NODE_4909_length_4634_cov_25.764498_5_plen_241_part_00